jgi:hypothetical protein
MKKLMRIPLYIPFIGMIVSFALLILVSYEPNEALMMTGLILLHLCGILAGAKFLLCGVGFFSTVLDTK